MTSTLYELATATVSRLAVFYNEKYVDDHSKTLPTIVERQPAMTLERKELEVELVSKTQVSVDAVALRFQFKHEGLILPVGKHVRLTVPNPSFGSNNPKWNGKPDEEASEPTIQRKYTPIVSDEKGFTLIVKVYKPNDLFPDGGKMSQYIDSLKPGDFVKVELPFGLMQYLGQGNFKRSKQEITAKSVVMVAGGSGITPMFRLLSAALADVDDKTTFYLIYANRSEENIIYFDELNRLAADHPERFKLLVLLSKPSAYWKALSGRVTSSIMQSFFPPLASDTLALLCGPPAMVEHANKDLQSMSLPSKQVWDF